MQFDMIEGPHSNQLIFLVSLPYLSVIFHSDLELPLSVPFSHPKFFFGLLKGLDHGLHLFVLDPVLYD